MLHTFHQLPLMAQTCPYGWNITILLNTINYRKWLCPPEMDWRPVQVTLPSPYDSWDRLQRPATRMRMKRY